MKFILIIGMLVVAIVIVLFATRGSTTVNVSCYTPEQEALAVKLMREIGPNVAGKTYTKEMIDQMVDYSPLFDQVMYFNFRSLVERGEFDEDKLIERSSSRMFD